MRKLAFLLVVLSVVFVSAAQQQPPPAAPPQTGAGQTGAPPAEPGAPPQGRGRGRGGPEVLQGGPQANDPAYANVDFSKKAPVLPKTPEEQLKTFILPPGYRLELVLADPIVQEPGAIAFDGNGRMFVLEIRGYMQDADAAGQNDPIGRVSLHEDTNNDGVYDKHSVFVDKLIFPRFLLPYGPNTLLTKESHSQDVWKYTDTNGDGVADKKELFDTGWGRLANVEHEESFLTYGMDNWLYSTVNSFRARQIPGGAVIKETTGSNGAQWGVTQDDDGKLWFQGGASGVPAYWQFPIVYGNFGGGRGGGGGGGEPMMDPELGITWGAPVRVADMQGGLSATRMPDGSLRGATGAAGSDVVRAHRLPADLQGHYVYGEPVGRIVRRVVPEKREGVTAIRNYYNANEFIKSTDPYFRPVDMATAPDGTVYVSDLYHGIIQESNWSGRGTYLRARIDQYDLDKVVHKGRIWRLVYDGVKRDRSDALDRDTTLPRMNSETPAQLVRHFSHPNGWWRDTAQQYLVLKQDKSIVPTLQTMLRNSTNLLEKFHVLWTLEGLGALDAATVRQQLEDREPRMRIQAIRASETLYKAGDRSFVDDYKRLTKDADIDVVIQAMLTLNRWKVPGSVETIKAVSETNKARGVTLVATNILNPNANAGGRGGPGARRRPDVHNGGDRRHREGRNDLQRALYDVPRQRRARHAKGGHVHDDGAADCGIATRERPSRLRGQDTAAWTHRASRRAFVHRADDPDGRESGRLDRGGGVVRPDQLRQHRRPGDAGRRQARARRGGHPPDAVDGGGARGITATRHSARHDDVEVDGESQSGGGDDGAEPQRLEQPDAAGARDVVPDRAAADRAGRRDSVRLHSGWWTRRRRRRTWTGRGTGCSGCARAPELPALRRAYRRAHHRRRPGRGAGSAAGARHGGRGAGVARVPAVAHRRIPGTRARTRWRRR